MPFDGRGIVCPDCGLTTDVIDTRPHQGHIRRRRVCPKGHRFSTNETVVQVRSKKPPKPKRLSLSDLPLTYLTANQKMRARAFFAAGWKAHEVAKLFDMTTAELRK